MNDDGKNCKIESEDSDEIIFDHNFGSIKKFEDNEEIPVHATTYYCMFYWST